MLFPPFPIRRRSASITSSAAVRKPSVSVAGESEKKEELFRILSGLVHPEKVTVLYGSSRLPTVRSFRTNGFHNNIHGYSENL
jgi:hypothetical protein